MTAPRTLKRIFIANRGEIARRIGATASRLGIESVTFCGPNGAPGYLTGVVTTFATVDEETTRVYLDAAGVIAAARAHGCDSVHPGFGFLSENAEFAQAVIDAGLVWIGPNPKAIAAMASKKGARDYAESAKVPCLPALSAIDLAQPQKSAQAVQEFGSKVGFPLIVKAALGGGGKGMRTVKSDDSVAEVGELLARAASEAKSSFGDPTLVIEKYLESPRHVEVQVFGDRSGQILALGDRDCSVQRRHQKVIEEAPAPAIADNVRKAMHAAAVGLARAVGYDSAGTVEFLVAESPQGQSFYFLEMNTRLQVEHPVTEAVFGIDLVEWQIRAASGEKLPAAWSTLEPRGHAIEVRLYLENCRDGYLPAPGDILGFRPHLSPTSRWEIGVDDWDIVTTAFDPMIGKAVAFGSDRTSAIDNLKGLLSKSFIGSRHNNMAWVRQCLEHKDFAAARLSTHFLANAKSELESQFDAERKTHAEWAEILRSRLENHGHSTHEPSVAGLTSQVFSGTPARADAGGLRLLEIKAQTSTQANKKGSLVQYFGTLECGTGTTQNSLVFHATKWQKSARESVFVSGLNGFTFWHESSGEELTQRGGPQAGGTDLRSPLPAKVVSILVKPGDRVAQGQKVFVLESMKMELEIKSPKSGIIAEVKTKEGAQIQQGFLLATWQAEG